MNGDFYNEIYKGRRCQVGLHNFTNFESDESFILLCKGCQYLQVGVNTIIVGDSIEADQKIYKSVHQDRDGFINYDKAY